MLLPKRPALRLRHRLDARQLLRLHRRQSAQLRQGTGDEIDSFRRMDRALPAFAGEVRLVQPKTPLALRERGGGEGIVNEMQLLPYGNLPLPTLPRRERESLGRGMRCPGQP